MNEWVLSSNRENTSQPPGRPGGGVGAGPSVWLEEGDAAGEALDD